MKPGNRIFYAIRNDEKNKSNVDFIEIEFKKQNKNDCNKACKINQDEGTISCDRNQCLRSSKNSFESLYICKTDFCDFECECGESDTDCKCRNSYGEFEWVEKGKGQKKRYQTKKFCWFNFVGISCEFTDEVITYSYSLRMSKVMLKEINSIKKNFIVPEFSHFIYNEPFDLRNMSVFTKNPILDYYSIQSCQQGVCKDFFRSFPKNFRVTEQTEFLKVTQNHFLIVEETESRISFFSIFHGSLLNYPIAEHTRDYKKFIGINRDYNYNYFLLSYLDNAGRINSILYQGNFKVNKRMIKKFIVDMSID